MIEATSWVGKRLTVKLLSEETADATTFESLRTHNVLKLVAAMFGTDPAEVAVSVITYRTTEAKRAKRAAKEAAAISSPASVEEMTPVEETAPVEDGDVVQPKPAKKARRAS